MIEKVTTLTKQTSEYQLLKETDNDLKLITICNNIKKCKKFSDSTYELSIDIGDSNLKTEIYIKRIIEGGNIYGFNNNTLVIEKCVDEKLILNKFMGEN